MMYVSDAPVQIPIIHYVEKLKEHEEKRLSFNERMEYWTNYRKLLESK